MYLLMSGIETNVAYGTCMLLFALLVLSVRNRKMAARSSHTFYASPLLGTIRPAPENKSTQGLRSATTPGHYSGLLLSTGLEYSPRERANTKPPESSAKRLDAPLDCPAVHISRQVKMDPSSFPFESPAPIAPAEFSAFTAPATTSTVRENIPSPPAVQSLVKIEGRRAQEIAIATDPHMANENPSDMSVVSKQRRMKASAINPQAPPVTTTREKTAATKLLAFYGLQQQPFDVTPDPAFLYFSPSHREALASLKQGIEHFRGFIMLVAEPGMGKTTLLNKLMEELSDSAQVVFLFQTQCSSRELLCFILNELEVDHAGMDIVAMHRALNQALLEEMLRGRRFVLVVDEAQNLQEPVLETIRLLSDFETTHSKLIQIVLAGQPQLADTLMRPSLVQLRQRIAVLSNLKPLSAVETAEYVDHRLRASGWRGGLLFTSDAVAQIAESSEGIPRSINNLSFNALLEAFQRGLKVIDADIVDEVADKLDLEALVRRPQMDLVSHQPAAPADAIGASQFARALAAALNAEAWPDVNSERMIDPKPKSS
jgi:general secretion pathway protein A